MWKTNVNVIIIIFYTINKSEHKRGIRKNSCTMLYYSLCSCTYKSLVKCIFFTIQDGRHHHMEHAVVSQSSTFNLALRQHVHANFNWKGITVIQYIIQMGSTLKLILLKAQKAIFILQNSTSNLAVMTDLSSLEHFCLPYWTVNSVSTWTLHSKV
jgi:hypothetical protein